ncbi:hypothetical protein IMF27_09815 [Pseudomonas sp. PCH199]|uniref:HNH endonuclease n=1 Tax=unclassified Pseudomonas TaxID=196821 RepID=UPI000BD1F439|nr:MULTISPECIES: HNH endonuclease [unclassified Pseudomonas]MCW8275956.1 hypothetical protein [Pseudomonas sp. PCH199]PAM84029.1 hypothetical protein CES87_10060 [Pseudomonas sp. ERMR1:02]
MSLLPAGRDRQAEEAEYLAKSHKRVKRRPHAAKIMKSENFFDASRRESRDVWGAFYATEWQTPAGLIKGAELMAALRDHLAELQDEQCCYCREPLLKGGYSRPIEHVLPRSEHPRFTLHFWNLAVSCERCNRLKGKTQSETFARVLSSYPDLADFVSQYHPRLHDYDMHIKYTAIVQNGVNIPLYAGRTVHGRNLCSQFLHAAALEMTLLSPKSKFYGDVNTIQNFIVSHDEAAIDKVQAVQTALLEAMVNAATG